MLAAAVLADALGPPIFSALPLERPRWLALGLLAIHLIGLAFLAFARIGEVLLTFIAIIALIEMLLAIAIDMLQN